MGPIGSCAPAAGWTMLAPGTAFGLRQAGPDGVGVAERPMAAVHSGAVVTLGGGAIVTVGLAGDAGAVCGGTTPGSVGDGCAGTVPVGTRSANVGVAPMTVGVRVGIALMTAGVRVDVGRGRPKPATNTDAQTSEAAAIAV